MEVPRNFDELIERHPTMVPNIVRRFLRYSRSLEASAHLDNICSAFEADVEEYIQDAYLHLMALAPTSRFRELGFNDRVELYDVSMCPSNLTPLKHFKLYLTEIVRRYLMTTLRDRKRDALCFEYEHEPLDTATLPVHFEPRMRTNVLLRECVDYISEATATGALKGENWKTLATKLGVTNADMVRPRVLYYLKVNADVHIEC